MRDKFQHLIQCMESGRTKENNDRYPPSAENYNKIKFESESGP